MARFELNGRARSPNAPADLSGDLERLGPVILQTSFQLWGLPLSESEPLIWRRIQVAYQATWVGPARGSAGRLRVEDRHLHEFDLGLSKSGERLRVGLPFEDEGTIRGWERQLTPDLQAGLQTCMYLYDFGDDWHVALVYEGRVAPAVPFRWSRCVAVSGWLDASDREP